MANRIGKNFLKAAGRLVLCFPVLFCFGKRPAATVTQPAGPLQAPEPLPCERIDIHSRPQVTQPERCTFLHDLPLELRHFIYEEVLGRRHVRLFITDDAKNRRQFVDSRSYAENAPSEMSAPISIALLRVCRQIYVEAHRILFENNIFDVYFFELNTVMLCGLGESVACPYIRKLRVNYWYRTYDPRALFDSDSATMPFEQIAAMPALSHLAFQFVKWDKYAIAPSFLNPGFACDIDPEEVLDSVWARGLLGTRIPNLQHLEINFVYPEGDSEVKVYAPKWKAVERTINELMVGDGAEERCQLFLKGSESRRAGKRWNGFPV
ncbi:hypothetical protein C8F01DRAFT_1251951 [Mycena amicta]|nr:hypothetical protein C8F01DRAFT_1251951 [Mycena amicta]